MSNNGSDLKIAQVESSLREALGRDLTPEERKYLKLSLDLLRSEAAKPPLAQDQKQEETQDGTAAPSDAPLTKSAKSK